MLRRIRDLGDHKIYSMAKAANYPALQSLIGGIVQTRRIEQYWDDLLRLICSIGLGTVSASLILGKLAAYPRQNELALALRELGRIERTLFTLEWIQSPELRRRVHLGLNKGEARNSLARAIFFYRRGAVRDRLREDLQNKVSGLNLVVAAIVLWNTVYLEQAVAALERQGTPARAAVQTEASPLHEERQSATGPDPNSSMFGGLISLDVTVTDIGGKAVSGLTRSDFTLLDDGQPVDVLSFRGFDELTVRPSPPVRAILLLDTLDLPANLASDERHAIEAFLRRDGGHLKIPMSVLELSVLGLWLVAQPSTDGNALASNMLGLTREGLVSPAG